MGSIILDGAEIGDHCFIGAGALVTANKVIPEGSLVYGNPAKIIRMLTEEERASIFISAKNYCEVALQVRKQEK
jgi:carbonic anhydrase/acetyltransferase-like protein (isoleucine patch superfamily)